MKKIILLMGLLGVNGHAGSMSSAGSMYGSIDIKGKAAKFLSSKFSKEFNPFVSCYSVNKKYSSYKLCNMVADNALVSRDYKKITFSGKAAKELAEATANLTFRQVKELGVTCYIAHLEDGSSMLECELEGILVSHMGTTVNYESTRLPSDIYSIFISGGATKQMSSGCYKLENKFTNEKQCQLQVTAARFENGKDLKIYGPAADKLYGKRLQGVSCFREILENGPEKIGCELDTTIVGYLK